MITSTPPEFHIKEEIDPETIEIAVPKKEAVEEAAPLTGKVDYFSSSKGFGFIINSNNKERYFFHISTDDMDNSGYNGLNISLSPIKSFTAPSIVNTDAIPLLTKITMFVTIL